MTAEDLLCGPCRDGRGMTACVTTSGGEHLHVPGLEMTFEVGGRPMRLANGRLASAGGEYAPEPWFLPRGRKETQ